MKFLLPILLLSMIACSSLTQEQCKTTNWVQKGESDGENGKSFSVFLEYEQQCREHAVEISKDNYNRGYNIGLRKYCTYKSGYSHGLAGEDPFTECDQISPTFYNGYEEGFRFFQMTVRKKRIDEQKDLDREKAIANILSSFNSIKCTLDTDCRKDGECRFNKCLHDDSVCNFNSDCIIKGSCSNESSYVSSLNEWVSTNVCKY